MDRERLLESIGDHACSGIATSNVEPAAQPTGLWTCTVTPFGACIWIVWPAEPPGGTWTLNVDGGATTVDVDEEVELARAAERLSRTEGELDEGPQAAAAGEQGGEPAGLAERPDGGVNDEAGHHYRRKERGADARRSQGGQLRSPPPGGCPTGAAWKHDMEAL